MGVVRTSIDLLTLSWLWLCLLLTPVIAHAGGMGFQLVGCGLGVAGLLLLIFNLKQASYLKQAWVPLFIAFSLWAWIASLWSPHEGADLLGNGFKLIIFAMSLTLMPLLFMRLTEPQKWVLAHIFMAGTVLAAGLMLFDVLSGFALSVFVDPVQADSNIYVRQGEAERAIGRGLTSYTHLIWPAIILMLTTLKRGWILALAVCLAFAGTAVLDRLSLTIPTLIVTGGFVAIAWYKPRFGLILAVILAIVSLLFAPLVGILSSLFDEAALFNLPLSWEHRVRMWAYSWDCIQQNWLFGNGFDASRSYQDTFQARDGRDIVIISLHPHNIGLQLWLETGLVGVGLAVAFLLASLKPLMAFCQTNRRASAMTGLIVATALNGALTIGVWQYWWWGVIALSACMVVLIPHKIKAERPLNLA